MHIPTLNVGDIVIYCRSEIKRWDRTGSIIELLDNRQYRVRENRSGRVTIKIGRFFRYFFKIFQSIFKIDPGTPGV